MGWQVGAKVVSTVARDLKAYERDLVRAHRNGLRAAGRGLQKDLRQQVQLAGLGARLGRSWRQRLFVDGDLDATAFVFTKAPSIIRAFDQGTVIRSPNGFALAVPTDAAPARGRGGKRLTPSNFPEENFGPLRFVFRPGKHPLLVVDGLVARRGKRGGFRKATVRKATARRGASVSLTGITTVPMFTLVPQVRPGKRLNVELAAIKWADRVPALIDAEVPSGASRAVRSVRTAIR